MDPDIQPFRQPQQFSPNGQLPAQPDQHSQTAAPKPKRSRVGLVIALVSIGLVLLVVVGAVVLLAVGNKPAKQTTKTNTVQTSASDAAKGASALDVEQTNQSISQDISGLNDGQDMPADQLSDKTLGL